LVNRVANTLFGLVYDIVKQEGLQKLNRAKRSDDAVRR
jgi:hypothetical protein